MLRAFVLTIGIAACAGAIVVALAVPHVWFAALELGIFGLLVIAGTLFERRYRFRTHAAGPQWQTTGERFQDPVTGKLTEVRFNPVTGERAYITLD